MKQPKIRSHYNPPEKEKLDIKFVYQRREDMAEARRPFEKEWDQADKQYEMFRDEKEDWQSNVTVPTTTSVVEAQLSEIIDQNLRPWYLPRGAEDKPRSIVMNAVSDYAWEVGRTDLEIYKGVKDALIRGTGILQDYYRKESRPIQLPSQDGDKDYEDKEMVEYDDLFAEVVKLEDFYVDERGRGFVGSYPVRDCVRRYVMTEDDFKNRYKGEKWDPLGNAKYVKVGGDTDYYEFYKPPEGIRKDKDIEVLWYWTTMPTPGRPNYYDTLLIVANDVLIKRCPIPYNHKRLPFVRIVDILRSHHFYGTGEAKLLESIQEEQNTLRRMVIDRNHLDIDKPFLVSNRETELDEEDIITRPHLMIPVEDVENIKPLEYGDIPRSVFMSLEQLQEDAVRVTGYDDRMQSVQKGGSTATEAAIVKEATMKRLRSKIWLLRNETVYQMGLIRESNIRQFYTVPKVERILGDKGTAAYRRKVRDAYQNDRLRMVDGKPHELKYRTIRLADRKLEIDKDNVEVKASKEPTFFEAVPELITPVFGSFDVRIEPTPTLPVSKPLMQERMSNLFDRLIQLALATKIYDPKKLGDMLLEAHDQDPDDMAPDKPASEQMNQTMIDKSIQLATVENNEMLSGKQLPPTPMAQEPHTEVHIAFLNSPQMSQVGQDDPILAVFTRHILGEIQEQTQRQAQIPPQMQGAMGQTPYKPPSGPSAPTMGINQATPAQGETQERANVMSQSMQS